MISYKGLFTFKGIFTFALLISFPFSCTQKIIEEGPNPMIEEIPNEDNEAPENNNKYTYLALGDSYTIGQGVPEHLRWPNQLKDRLMEKNIELSQVTFIAQTGMTTTDLLLEISSENPSLHDLVSLLIGVNNQYQGVPFSVFENEFDSLLNLSINLAGNSQRVFVVSIPDYSVTPFISSDQEKIAEEIDAYNHYMEDRCHALGIPYVDVTEVSRQLGSTENALAPDGLHPSGYQYDKWVDEILPVVNKLLEK